MVAECSCARMQFEIFFRLNADFSVSLQNVGLDSPYSDHNQLNKSRFFYEMPRVQKSVHNYSYFLVLFI